MSLLVNNNNDSYMDLASLLYSVGSFATASTDSEAVGGPRVHVTSRSRSRITGTATSYVFHLSNFMDTRDLPLLRSVIALWMFSVSNFSRPARQAGRQARNAIEIDISGSEMLFVSWADGYISTGDLLAAICHTLWVYNESTVTQKKPKEDTRLVSYLINS